MHTYVLELADSCWYVGRSKQINTRMWQHWTGRGAKWLKFHPPLRVAAIYSGDKERQVTLQYIKTYGLDRVRGGPWCAVDLRSMRHSPHVEEQINPMALSPINTSVIEKWSVGPAQQNIHGGRFWNVLNTDSGKTHPKFQLGGDELSLRCPFGLSQYSVDSKWTLDMSVPQWLPEQTFLKAIDAWIVETVHARQGEFFPKNQPMSKLQLQSMYTPLLSQNGEYEPKIRARVNKDKLAVFKVVGDITARGTADDITPGCQCVPVISLSKIWTMGQRFGCSAWCEAAMVWPRQERSMNDIFSTNLGVHAPNTQT